MREFKFRAWDNDDRKMFKVIRISFEEIWGDDDEGILMCPFDEFAKDKDADVRHSTNYILMQYTGLKDKNGREIYEGDLYKFIISHDMYNPESGHTTFEVVHVKAVTFEDGAFYHGTHLLSEIIEFDDSFTYVGNIYENPELLEESQNGTK